jgi:glycosyltransferase involved in cell wall biosynthesis
VIARYKSPAQHAEIEKKVGGGDVDVLVCDFLTPSVNVPASLPCPAVLFQHNVEAVIWRRHYEVRSNPLARLFFRQQWRKMLAYERSVCRAYNHVVAVSPEDRDIMRDEYGLAKVSDVPTGVDTQYFRPAGRVCSEPYNLVFSGSMDWLPNEDAVWYFAKTILPRIAAEIPRVTLTVVGRKPSARLTELARNDPRLHVTGYVDDVRPYLERAGVYVVPLRIGSGTRLKIFEAMAMEKPVVATPVGAEGLRVTDGRELLLADSPDAFADAVVRLLRDRKLAKALAIQGACRVRRDFGWQNTAARFAEICERVLRDEAGRPDHLAICRPAV